MKHRLTIRLEKRKKLEGEKLPVFADIRFSGERLNYYTGIKADANSWDVVTQRLKKNSFGFEGKDKKQYSELNKKFVNLESELIKYFDGVTIAQPDDIKQLLDINVFKKSAHKPVLKLDFWGLWESYANRPNISFARQKTIKTTINQWLTFEKHTQLKNKKFVLSIETFSHDILVKFETYQSKVRGMGKNTIHSRLAVTKGFYKYAKSILASRGTILPELFGKDSEGLFQLKPERYGKPIYLNREEREKLSNFDFRNVRLNQIRDVFIFQCMVGMRVGDMIELTKNNVNEGVLSYIPRKTREKKQSVVNVPLTDQAQSILAKYSIPGGKLLPFVSPQKYNDYIKEIFLLAGLNRMVTRLNQVTQEEEHLPLYQIASSHMARRTFVGRLYEQGIDRAIISSMSGHSEDSKAFARYFKVSMNQKLKAINNL